jgi:hypothetical protein
MTLVPFRRPSSSSKPPASSLNTPNSSSLGNKLQVLAGESPAHLAAIEAFVDLILEHLSHDGPGSALITLALLRGTW